MRDLAGQELSHGQACQWSKFKTADGPLGNTGTENRPPPSQRLIMWDSER